VLLANVFPLATRGFEDVYKSTAHALHLHDYHGTIRIDRQQFTLVPGSLTFSPAGSSSSYDLPRAGSHWCIHFQPLGRAQPDDLAIALPLHRDVSRWNDIAAARFANVIRLHGASERDASSAILPVAASSALQELLVWFGLLDVVNAQTQTAARDKAVDDVTALIDRNLQSPQSAPELAAKVGLSQNYLARVFKHQTGTTIAQYLIAQRVALAKVLLRSTELSIKQIGIRVGYADPQHFNKIFRSVAGQSPSAYRSASQ